MQHWCFATQHNIQMLWVHFSASSLEPRSNNPAGYFPWNTGWLIGILIVAYEIIPPKKPGRISSPTYTLNDQVPFFHCSHTHLANGPWIKSLNFIFPIKNGITRLNVEPKFVFFQSYPPPPHNFLRVKQLKQMWKIPTQKNKKYISIHQTPKIGHFFFAGFANGYSMLGNSSKKQSPKWWWIPW